jgi:hypothetical protein
VVKLRQGDRPIISLRQAREDLGYTTEQIAVMEGDDARAVDRVLAGDFESLLGPKPTPVADGA